MIRRQVSLYFGGIRASDAVVLLWTWARRAPAARARKRFEREIAVSLRAPLVRLFGSARGALTTVLEAAKIGEGDEVVVTGFTCAAVPMAVRAAKATPVYADIDTTSLTSPLPSIQAAFSSRTRAIIVQHTLGVMAEIAEIVAFARGRGLLVIEDCALALGSSSGGRPAGSFGDAAIFSFELSKTITTGWGGALVVHSTPLVEAVTAAYDRVEDLPASEEARRVWQTIICAILYSPFLFPVTRFAVAVLFKVKIFRGSTPAREEEGIAGPLFVHRMPAAPAALGWRSWRRSSFAFSRITAARTAILDVLHARRAQIVGVPMRSDTCISNRVSWLTHDPDAAVRWFAKRGIEAGRWFDAPVSPASAVRWALYRAGSCPSSEMISRHIVNVPAHARLRGSDVRAIADAISEFCSVTES
jgi:perosamine synthetase